MTLTEKDVKRLGKLIRRLKRKARSKEAPIELRIICTPFLLRKKSGKVSVWKCKVEVV